MPTIAEMKTKALKFFNDIDLPENDIQKLMDYHFKHADNSVVAAAVDFIASKTEEINLFQDICKSVLPPEAWAHMEGQIRPLITFPKDKFNMVHIYPNVILNAVPYSDIKDISIFDAGKALSKFIEGYDIDMSGVVPGAEKRWETPERVQKRLGQIGETTLGSMLTNEFGFEKLYKPDVIRDMATKIETARKPLELLFADKPEDFMIMYGSTGPHSCMVTGHWPSIEKHGITATSFYAYFPYTRGAYIMKRGRVVARTMLYADPAKSNIPEMGWPKFNKAAGSGWRYGYMYQATTQDAQELIKALRSHGITPLDSSAGAMAKGNNFVPPVNEKFQIPGYLVNKDYIAPFPFFDNMDYRGSGFFAEYDKETHMFSLHHNSTKNNNAGNTPANNRNGFIKASDYIAQVCDQCHNPIFKGSGSTTDDGHLYCGNTCLKSAGYSIVHQGNGSKWCKVEDEKAFVKTADGSLFTNMVAAMQNGYGFETEDPHIMAEEIEPLVNWNVAPNKYGVVPDYEGFYQVRGKEYDGITNLVPIEVVSQKKTVVFDPEQFAA